MREGESVRDDMPTIEERYGCAVEATDLSLRYERTGRVDVIAAAGMVGARHPLCLSVWRWIYGDDANERHAVLAGLLKWTSAQAKARRWDKRRDLVVVVVTVADWHKHKACPACHGTRYEVIEGTPTLSDVPCRVCHGSGMRSLDKLLLKYGPDWIKRGRELSAYVDRLICEANGDMLKKMAQDMYVSGL